MPEINQKQIEDLLTEVESKGKTRFFLTSSKWYFIILTIGLITSGAVFAIPEDSPLLLVRTLLGVIFLLLLPGYALTKLLYPKSTLVEITKTNVTMAERYAIALGMSLALLPILGLFLNFTPWGVTMSSATLMVLCILLITATSAIVIDYIKFKQRITELKTILKGTAN